MEGKRKRTSAKSMMRAGLFGLSKEVMVGVIVVCIIAAVAITIFTRQSDSGGIESIPSGEMIWVKCANKDCAAEYEMGKRKYFEDIEKRVDPMAMSAPPLVCEKCGEESIYHAIKCGNQDCGKTFFKYSVPNDFSDRCPDCGYSEMEQRRKKAAASRGQ